MGIAIAVVLGIALGFTADKLLFVGSALTLIPWGVAAVILGWFMRGKKEALINGALYGFILSVSFMVIGYNGTRSIIAVLPFFVLLGLFGAVCGGILGVLGNWVGQLFSKEKIPVVEKRG